MYIRSYSEADLSACAALIRVTYNAPPWNDSWTQERAERYVREFTEYSRFVGFVLQEQEHGPIIGVTLCRVKTWWSKDELYVDELYVHPDHQRKGYGRALIDRLAAHCAEKRLGAVTLITDERYPAMGFYEQNGFRLSPSTRFLFRSMPENTDGSGENG